MAGFLADYAQNLSRGAVFLNTRRAQAVGSRVRVTVSLRRPAMTAGFIGRVDRIARFGNDVNEAPGMQLRIVQGGSRLERLVSELLAVPQG
jgi:Tfp pilus assembly protein PilZ